MIFIGSVAVEVVDVELSLPYDDETSTLATRALHKARVVRVFSARPTPCLVGSFTVHDPI